MMRLRTQTLVRAAAGSGSGARATRRLSGGGQGLTTPPPPEDRASNPGLVVFDKDGTLIDFQFMWGSWAESFAWRMEMATKANVREQLFDKLGYDYIRRSVRSGGALCCTPMRNLRHLGELTLVESELKLTPEQAERVVSSVWQMPDPVSTARPLADLRQIFSILRMMDIKVAVCTTDDHDATERTLEALKVRHLVDIVVGGDDPIQPKPSPDQLYYICSKLGVAPHDTIMVGDTSTDMKLGRNAGAGLSVGVLDGASSIRDLAEFADVLVPSVAKIPKIAFQWKNRARLGGVDVHPYAGPSVALKSRSSSS